MSLETKRRWQPIDAAQHQILRRARFTIFHRTSIATHREQSCLPKTLSQSARWSTIHYFQRLPAHFEGNPFRRKALYCRRALCSTLTVCERDISKNELSLAVSLPVRSAHTDISSPSLSVYLQRFQHL